jgi:hypothetical protein
MPRFTSRTVLVSLVLGLGLGAAPAVAQKKAPARTVKAAPKKAVPPVTAEGKK